MPGVREQHSDDSGWEPKGVEWLRINHFSNMENGNVITTGVNKKVLLDASEPGGGVLFPPLAVATTYRKSVRRSAAVWKLLNYLRAWIGRVERDNRVSN